MEMGEHFEQPVRRKLPGPQRVRAGARLDVTQLRAVSRESSERLHATRLAVMQGRVFTDSSADLLHEDRDERESREEIAGG